MNDKLGEFSQLIGHILVDCKKIDNQQVKIITNNPDHYFIFNVNDDGFGGNDSRAYIKKFKFKNTARINDEMIGECKVGDKARPIFHDASGNYLEIIIHHKHNGYYGFNYELKKHEYI